MDSTQTTKEELKPRERTNTRPDKRRSTVKTIYRDKHITISYDSSNFILQIPRSPHMYYPNLSWLFTSLLNIKMKKALSLSSLDIPVKQFKEITDQAVNEVKQVADIVRFTLND